MGGQHGVYSAPWKSRANPLSLPSSLTLTHGDLACLAEGEKSGNKRMSDQCRVAMAS